MWKIKCFFLKRTSRVKMKLEMYFLFPIASRKESHSIKYDEQVEIHHH